MSPWPARALLAVLALLLVALTYTAGYRVGRAHAPARQACVTWSALQAAELDVATCRALILDAVLADRIRRTGNPLGVCR